jgi:hypothetical protein
MSMVCFNITDVYSVLSNTIFLGKRWSIRCSAAAGAMVTVWCSFSYVLLPKPQNPSSFIVIFFIVNIKWYLLLSGPNSWESQ